MQAAKQPVQLFEAYMGYCTHDTVRLEAAHTRGKKLSTYVHRVGAPQLL